MKKENKGFIIKRKDGSEIVNYNDDKFPSYIHDGYVYSGCTWERVPHYHKDVEFIYVYNGDMGYSVQGMDIKLSEGAILFVNSDRIHYSYTDNDYVTRYIIAVIDPSIICTSYAVENKAVRPIITDKTIPFVHFHADDHDSEDVRRILWNMHRVSLGNEFLITKDFILLWELLMHRFNDAYRLFLNHRSDDQHDLILKNMMIYIDGHYTENISLKDIAAAGGVSQTLCNQIFNKVTGKSPVEYLIHYRSRKVADYLETSKMSMAEIAEITGFSGASYMSEVFRRFYKMSPREYRKNVIDGTTRHV